MPKVLSKYYQIVKYDNNYISKLCEIYLIMFGALRMNREGNHKIIWVELEKATGKNSLTFDSSQKGRNLRRISTT